MAALSGVSIKTVSRVLNKERTVNSTMREAVERAVAQLGYRPNVSARALAGSRSYLIGLIYDNPSPNYISELQFGAMRACRKAGVHLVVEKVPVDASDVVERICDAVATPRLDGVILSPPLSDSEAVMRALEELAVPYVRIAPHDLNDRAPSVVIDDHGAAAEMTSYLWEKGHRNIAFLAAPKEHAAAARRKEGFIEALTRHGGEIPDAYIQEGAFTTVSGVEAGLKFLSLPHRPTAIFAANDEMAAGVMIAAYQCGIQLPAELSVVGFDDSPIAQALHPLLTTVRQPTAEMAEAAVEILTSGLEVEPSHSQVLDFELVERDSVSDLPSPGGS